MDQSTISNDLLECSRKAVSMMTSSMRIKISKFVTRTLPVGHIMEQRNNWKESFCPRCGKTDETPQHILQCSDKGTRKVFKEVLEKFERVLVKLHTERILRIQLICYITEWITQGEVFIHKDTIPPIQDQHQVGWLHLMEGCFHTSFEIYMDDHYNCVRNKKTGRVWVSVTIQSLWSLIFLPLWEHRNKAVHVVETKPKLSRDYINLNFTIREF